MLVNNRFLIKLYLYLYYFILNYNVYCLTPVVVGTSCLHCRYPHYDCKNINIKIILPKSTQIIINNIPKI